MVRSRNSYDSRGVPVLMGHSIAMPLKGTVPLLRETRSPTGPVRGTLMKYLKSQAFRAMLMLSALASSALVLEAGKRWGS